jgi:hypothetical protein
MPMLIPVLVAYAATSVAISAGLIVAGTLAAAAFSTVVTIAVAAAMNSGSDDDQQATVSGGGPESLVTVRQPIAPWQVIYGEDRVPGVITFIEVSSYGGLATNNILNVVITLAGHECEEIGDVYFNDEVVPLDGGYPNGGGNVSSGRYAGYATVQKSLGDEAGQPFPELVNIFSNGKWTDAHRQTGRTKLYVRLVWNPDVFPTGVPNVTAVVKGRKVYDPRTALTAWSANAALCTADFLCNSDFGLGAVYADEIDEDQLIAGANVCDEAVTLAAGGTEPRYELNGSFWMNATPRDILGRLLTAMRGSARFIGGRWRIEPAAYVVPAITLTADDLRGPVHILPRLSRRDLCNGVKGVYRSPDNNWQQSDFPVVTNATYLAEDQGERIWRDINLPFTTSVAAAQRIAKIELEKTRQQITVELPCKLTAYTLKPGDTVMLTLSRYGWSAKVFEVVNSRLSFDTDDQGGVSLGVDHVLRETASAVFDWNSGEETVVDPAPDTDLPSPFDVGVPGTPVVTEELYETTGSAGVKARATVVWAAAANAFVAFYELEYKLEDAAEYARISPISSLSQVLDDKAPGTYNFRVRSVNGFGVRSEYSLVTTYELLGLTAAPADAIGFYVTVHEGRARCHVSKTTDLDVAIGGRLWIRWSPIESGAEWNDGSLIKAEGYPGDSIVVEGPLYPGTYMAKFQDSSGNFSEAEASFVVTESLLTGFTTLATVTFHTAFAGTKVNVATIDSVLQLTGSTLWDSIPGNMDSWDRIDSLGGIASSGSCTFTSKMDLGGVETVRLVPSLKTLGFDTGDLWDTRTDLMDAWGLVDGSVIEDAEIQPQVRITEDDPASGGASWGPWHNLEVSDYTARGFEFRTLHTSANVTHNRRLLEFSVAAKQPS